MAHNDVFARSLAVVGTTLVTLPLLAPLALGLSFAGRFGGVRIDYLMPFEVYPVTVVGTVLLVAGSLRLHARRRAIGVTIAAMLGTLVLMGVSAQVTGIANSPEQLDTWRYVLTAGFGAASLAAQVVLASLGGLMLRDAYRDRRPDAPTVTHAPGV